MEKSDDKPVSRSLHQADARITKRRRAEWRLKAYGISAIIVSGLALFALLSSVLINASGALTESYVTLSVFLDEEELDPTGARDPKTILRSDFNGLTKDVLKDTFPTVTDRKAKRQMYDLVSVGAAYELAEEVSQNPGLVGQSVDFDFLASDVTDLYLKGSFGGLSERKTAGSLSVEEGRKTVTLSSTGNDFVSALSAVRGELGDEAASLRRKAALLNNGVLAFQKDLERAETDEAKEAAQSEIDSRGDERDQLLKSAEALEARINSIDGEEKIGRKGASIFVVANGGWAKLTRVSATTAEAKVLVPFSQIPQGETEWSILIADKPEFARKVSDLQIALIETLKDTGAIKTVFNTRFFTAGDSREPELAGIWGAAVGSFWTMIVTFVLAFPIGVLSAIYLEEFAPKNKLTDFIEVNINNLAAVPSIIFGLLGLAVVIGFFGVPRSAPLAGGIVMALMTLPTIIIASRAAIAAVPPSIRDAALGVGASPLQATFHHVLPLSVPGMLTGSILGMARALGETAPLIMIGMVAFIVDVPKGITDSATVLPVQVYRWSDFPERAFEARTAAAICVLLVFLIMMNALAIFLRRRFERRW